MNEFIKEVETLPAGLIIKSKRLIRKSKRGSDIEAIHMWGH